jgi:signal transduction histidine kinase
VLAVLRNDNGPTDLVPQPGLAELPDLVERCREAGWDVELSIDELPPLSPGRELTAYRIVQEALTNAMRYAGPAAISVAVRTDADLIAIDVADDGRGGAPSRRRRGDPPHQRPAR